VTEKSLNNIILILIVLSAFQYQINIEKEWQQFEPQQPFSNQGHGFVFAD